MAIEFLKSLRRRLDHLGLEGLHYEEATDVFEHNGRDFYGELSYLEMGAVIWPGLRLLTCENEVGGSVHESFRNWQVHESHFLP